MRSHAPAAFGALVVVVGVGVIVGSQPSLSGSSARVDATTAGGQVQAPAVAIDLLNTSGPQPRLIEALEIGDSLSISVKGLQPEQPIEIYLHDDKDQEWSYARVMSTRGGTVEPTLLWYQSGVIGVLPRHIAHRPEPAFTRFEEAFEYFSNHSLRLTVRDLRGEVLAMRDVPTIRRTSPLLYPSTKEGDLVNALNMEFEDLYVTGLNFPRESTVSLLVAANRHTWNPDDPLADVTASSDGDGVETVTLQSQTQFTVPVWTAGPRRVGAFDIVARINDDFRDRILRPTDVLTYNDDTGVLAFVIVNGNIVIDVSGRYKSNPANFEFNDSFERGEDVWGAVDPTDVPLLHPGGSYAAYWVVNDQPDTYWDGVSPALVDVSGFVEIYRAKAGCINATRNIIWPIAIPAGPIRNYDVIVDFGATAAMTAAAFVHDNTYNKGLDFIDGYQNVGFTLFEDPSTTGPFPVGTVTLDDPSGISGISDPTGITGPTQPVTLAWARIMYPATFAGTGAPVSPVQSNYPVALFLHGRHFNCDADGAGPGLSGSNVFTCATANRIPSHEGYNYIMQRLASQGIVAISISAHQIQPGLGIWDYNARGRLVLKWLDKLRGWTTVSGSDPFGGIFFGKLDMAKIALSGHSRGGEGVVAADVLNLTWPTPHSIVAVNAIAPTDQNGTSYVPTRSSYFLLTGSRDGDVWNQQGFRTYDRAYPQGMVLRHPKTIGWVYGANHNYFNTIWTNTAQLGSPNPWAGSVDDASGVTVMQSLTGAQQRQIGLTTICAFFRWHLQAIDAYKEIFTGRVRPAAMANNVLYWTYQDDERKALDNFEQTPLNPAVNTLGGAVTAAGFTLVQERLFNFDSTDYPAQATDNQFFHDTLGLKLAWGASQIYTTNLPVGQRDVSAFTHLSLRAAKRLTGGPSTGPDLSLMINIEDGAGNQANWDLMTLQFNPIPHPYYRTGGLCGTACDHQAQLVGVRIPLRNFAQNNSGVDLTNIVKVIIKVSGSGDIGLDDIEFGK